MFEDEENKKYDVDSEYLENNENIVINTKKGKIKIKLLWEEAPNTVANFLSLIEDKFYDDLLFHRVIEGFMAQAGCPNGTGTGGPGWCIDCECDDNTSIHKKGTLSMAHAGRDTGGSQFFICFDNQPHLDKQHTIFGIIPEDDEESFDILDSIEQSDTIESIEIVTNKKTELDEIKESDEMTEDKC
jgi:peptidyl-prolyl cis-trans isomerase B (cyclophilin B)